MIRKLLLTLIAPALLAACGTPGVAGSAPSTSPTATVSATASATPTPTPTPVPTAIPTPTPAPPRVTPTVFVANNMALGTVPPRGLRHRGDQRRRWLGSDLSVRVSDHFRPGQ